MKILNVTLDTVCGYTSTLPEFDNEIAFAGRSNVGKSSLINVIMQRKRLARVGETPGKTRTINFYSVTAEMEAPEDDAADQPDEGLAAGADPVLDRADGMSASVASAPVTASAADSAAAGEKPKKLRWKKDPSKAGRGKGKNRGSDPSTSATDKCRRSTDRGSDPYTPGADKCRRRADRGSDPIRRSFFLVDLPGYGFANVPEEEKARWGRMIERYLNSSKGLKRVFLLVDIRHEPNANDIQMYDWIRESGFTPVIVATKADKLKRSQLKGAEDMVRNAFGAGEDTPVIPFSAMTKQGAHEICSVIRQSVLY